MKFRSLYSLLLFAGATLTILAAEKDEPKDLRALLQQGLFEEQANRDLEKASAAYEAVAARYESARALAATALFRLAEVRAAQGRPPEAIALYQRVLADFAGEESLAKLSRERLAALGAAPGPAGEQARPAAPTEAEARELAAVAEIARNSPDLLNGELNGESPLSKAAAKGWLRVAEFLMAHGAQVQVVPSGPAPLLAAARNGHKAMVEFLLAHGADVNARQEADGPTPLIGASVSGSLEVARVLLEHGADVHAVDAATSAGHGITALLEACMVKRTELAALLLARGAEPNALYAEGDASPLLIACENGQAELVKLLLDHRADPNFAAGQPPQSPLSAAIEHGHAAVAELLLARGAKVDGAGRGGITPLHLAAGWPWQPDLVKLLLARGASPLARAAGGVAPLIYSVARAMERDASPKPEEWARLRSVWELLLAADAKINAADEEGETLLHKAMSWEKLPSEHLIWLVERGADLYRRNRRGNRPVDYALGERQLAVEKRFVFPKVIDPQAIMIAVRLPLGLSRLEKMTPAGEGPVTLADALRYALMPESEPARTGNLPSSRPVVMVPDAASGRSVAGSLPASFAAVILRAPAAGGLLVEAARVPIDFNGPDSQGLKWPDLKLGDLMVLLDSKDALSFLPAESLDQRLTELGFPVLGALGAKVESPFAIRALRPAIESGGETFTWTHGEAIQQTVALEPKPLLDDSALESASLERVNGRPTIRVQLTQEGSRDFAEITKLYAGRQVGFVVADRLICAPVLNDIIISGNLEIPGDYTETQARVWVALMKMSVSAGGFVTTPGKHHFFSGALRVSVSGKPDGPILELGSTFPSPSRRAYRDVSGMKDGWFIFPESETRIWIYEGKGRSLRFEDLGESAASVTDVVPGSPQFAKAPKAVAERYLQAMEKNGTP